ncbi:hypothetical protein AOCH_006244 [Aspergillus ochraceoroseus]|uniref:PH domain-containing protein n=1 Tax=Aspergillus ochraceoroseus TaxID=138278 RepID=A0A0F8UDT4_9EURO|nr:hypothetical protein AOCH_006244 [Aspergillus ochraceoroseus]
MSTTSSPVDKKLPHRSSTLRSTISGFERRASMSDDEAIPGSDSNETTNLLLERLRAWKHMCGYLEDYVSATSKVQKSMSKDFEKILKTVNEPLKEGHHFSQSAGGVSSFFESVRSNTQGMANLCLDGERNLKTVVLPILEKLHKDIKVKSSELQTGASKGAKAVERARNTTQKHIDLLTQNTSALDATSGSKVDASHDPYILRRGVVHRLNKQVIEENNNRQDIIVVQNNFQQFEAHILQTIQGALEQLVEFMGNQSDRQKTINDSTLVDPDAPPRSLANISFPNQDHRTTQPLIEGSLERKSRTVLKGYSTGYYVITPARYLHELKDNDDLRKDPSPELSLYLPDCLVGAIDGNKFTVKGKDVSGGVVGNAFHASSELSFKAPSARDAEKWWNILKDATRGPIATTVAAAAAAAVSPIVPSSPAVATHQPPAYLEKDSIPSNTAATASSVAETVTSPVSEKVTEKATEVATEHA